MMNFIHPILYILNKANKPLDTHKISKILYFADRNYIAKYGTLITGDSYIPMKYGPVPSNIYNIIKTVLGKEVHFNFVEIADTYFESKNDKLVPKTTFDADEFSETEIECLDKSIKEYLDKSFQFLTDKSHDLAWNSAKYSMDNLKIAESGGADKNMLDYIKSHQETLQEKYF